MNRDFIKDALSTEDGLPLKADIILIHNENTRLLADFMHRVRQYPNFVIIGEDIDTRRPKIFKPPRMPVDRVTVLCIQGSIEAQR